MRIGRVFLQRDIGGIQFDDKTVSENDADGGGAVDFKGTNLERLCDISSIYLKRHQPNQINYDSERLAHDFPRPRRHFVISRMVVLVAPVPVKNCVCNRLTH